MINNDQSVLESDSEYKRLESLLQLHKKDLMTKANVVGVGIGYKEKKQQRTETLSLIVMVSKKLPRTMLTSQDIIPFEIEGIPVDVVEVGQIITLPKTLSED